ncbi:uncharacterized protein TrAFT101_007072 [Trichoderma asperellum]|uniref:uncharacterized protein n=1 Tax=Trichoderma asperellum TaxID=101201 RepID=UPI003317F05C|nr:hypothetical protein TrAFT101_007072 [Trichoderma asperellum]
MQPVRAVLSCTSCRQRKLKCDRIEPCGNCIARNVDCVYVVHPRIRGSAQTNDGYQRLNARIRHLEQLISAADTPMPQRDASSDHICQHCGRVPDLTNGVLHGQPQQENTPDLLRDEQSGIKPGRIISSDSQTTYVCGVHWAAIYNEITDISRQLDQDSSTDDFEESEAGYGNGPMLLGGLWPTASLEDILSDIPPRDLADRLVSRYFNSLDPSVVLLHAPTFEQEYKGFWLDEKKPKAQWLGLLFGILSMGTFLYLRSRDPLPGTFDNPKALMDIFQRRSTECLILSKYSSSPGTHTMEALLLNIQNEFLRHREAHLGIWILGGVVVRLAMRMGYHRDSAGYSQVSVFHGEMRRRVWAMILQLDTLTSCQLGLPPMIQELQCDTQLPRNLLDDDFGPDSVQLPSARPETELTPVLYTITKSRLLTVFRAIFNQVSLGRLEAYTEIMALDQRLRNEHASISPRFRMTNLENSVTTSVYLLMRRYNIEFLFQKARCILHRHHMTKSYRDSTFSFSRSSCIDAAMAILSHQANILREVQVGGLLYRDKWFVSSLEQHDFLLASMIICLELSFRARGEAPAAGPSDADSFPKYSERNLVESLRNSRHFWDEFKATAPEAQQAFHIVSVMLDMISRGSRPQKDRHVMYMENAENTGNLQGNPQVDTGKSKTFVCLQAYSKLICANSNNRRSHFFWIVPIKFTVRSDASIHSYLQFSC